MAPRPEGRTTARSERVGLVRPEGERRLEQDPIRSLESAAGKPLVAGDQLRELAREPFEIPRTRIQGASVVLRILDVVVPAAQEKPGPDLVAREDVGASVVAGRHEK